MARTMGHVPKAQREEMPIKNQGIEYNGPYGRTSQVRWPFPREKNIGLRWAQIRREEEKGPMGRPAGISIKQQRNDLERPTGPKKGRWGKPNKPTLFS